MYTSTYVFSQSFTARANRTRQACIEFRRRGPRRNRPTGSSCRRQLRPAEVPEAIAANLRLFGRAEDTLLEPPGVRAQVAEPAQAL